MDYAELATEWLQKMRLLKQARPQQNIDASLHGEAFVLQFIAHNNETVLPSDISRTMGVSSAMVATALNRLENKGLITRRIDQNDRRRILVGITNEGKNLADSHRQLMLGTAEKMLGLLGEHDAKEYVRITGKLASKISKPQEHSL